jgi:hypothetical protein
MRTTTSLVEFPKNSWAEKKARVAKTRAAGKHVRKISIWRAISGIAQPTFDALANVRRQGHALQLGPDREEHILLEGVLTGARRAGLEVSPHLRQLMRCQLTIDILVHPAKNLFAGVAIQWRHDAE